MYNHAIGNLHRKWIRSQRWPICHHYAMLNACIDLIDGCINHHPPKVLRDLRDTLEPLRVSVAELQGALPLIKNQSTNQYGESSLDMRWVMVYWPCNSDIHTDRIAVATAALPGASGIKIKVKTSSHYD